MQGKILLFLLLFSLVSCKGLFQYSPNEVRLEDSEKNLNQKNIEKILAQPAGNQIRFIATGDSQRFYEELDAFVEKVNTMQDISFVLLNGDIADFGLGMEFKWVNERLSRLKVPYLAVIGNHDMLANGRLVYNKMFGPENFSFAIGDTKFICFNSNSEEVGFDGTLPNMSWIGQQLAEGAGKKNVFLFSHVPPFSPAFDPAMVDNYTNSLNSAGNVRMSIHAHQHQFGISKPYGNGVEYLVAASMDKRNFSIITVNHESFSVEEESY